MSQDYHFRSCDIFSTRNAGRPGCKRASYGCLYLCLCWIPMCSDPTKAFFTLSRSRVVSYVCVCVISCWSGSSLRLGPFLPLNISYGALEKELSKQQSLNKDFCLILDCM